MNKNIIIAGVGGQGILTIASIIDMAAMRQGLFVKQAEVHGMSQRGGEVQSHLRISDTEIFSDLIPLQKADIILSVEPMEALRYLPYLKPDGIIITATNAFKNIPDYPDEDKLTNSIKKSANSIFVDAAEIARQAGNQKSYNVVMLGAACKYIGINIELFEWAIGQLFAAKGQSIIDLNINALRKGFEYAENYE